MASTRGFVHKAKRDKSPIGFWTESAWGSHTIPAGYGFVKVSAFAGIASNPARKAAVE
jgi:hypothetical protein